MGHAKVLEKQVPNFSFARRPRADIAAIAEASRAPTPSAEILGARKASDGERGTKQAVLLHDGISIIEIYGVPKKKELVLRSAALAQKTPVWRCLPRQHSAGEAFRRLQCINVCADANMRWHNSSGLCIHSFADSEEV